MVHEQLRCFRLYRSALPDRSVPLMLGIDEAGRGPVLGPMVYGGFVSVIEDKCENVLKRQIRVDDSKKLTPAMRSSMFQQLNDRERKFAVCAEVITPRFISYKMLQKEPCNLNTISHNSAISIIKHFLSKGFNIKQVYIDAVGSCEKYEAKLKGIFPDLQCVVANKADSKFPVVSAASIVAKVIRDNMVDSWFRASQTQVATGSGYPGDPLTRKMLIESIDKVFGFSELVRSSWATAKNILEDPASATPFEWYDIDEVDEDERYRNNLLIKETQGPPFRTIKCLKEI